MSSCMGKVIDLPSLEGPKIGWNKKTTSDNGASSEGQKWDGIRKQVVIMGPPLQIRLRFVQNLFIGPFSKEAQDYVITCCW